MAHEITSHKNQPQFSQTTMRHYWLVRLNQAQTSFQIDPKHFQQVATEFKKNFIQWNFLVTD